ncbi:serine/threonine-protein kinase Nek11-like [Seriola lalandi dorsalis]|uniref:serine/threonine-protein kinase Nek11-like n=1 Tax=Seriola lalandi dorsalis TaxID=1841481 RepID=UPI000C6F5678|nr:serine/threonine-protein kinase Nek11-like [Seriola lalandi dorsalis]
MPRFQEVESGQAPPSGGSGLVAKRYNILQSLGRGSFGSVYLVQDTRAADGEKLKVLKQIPLGDLRPDETVRATQEAQLLSQLHHPAILTFYHSFLERDAFCIITEYCQMRESGNRAGKVLKQIPLGDLRPDETVRATQEAQLLSQLHHPAILTFYHSFLERDAFCIITEYCQVTRHNTPGLHLQLRLG